MIFAIEPIQRGPNILRFSLPMSMLPLTQSESTKVESQHRKSEAVQRFHRMKDDLVMHRSAINRMRMANQCSMIRAVRARVEKCLESPCRAFDEQGTNCAGLRLHAEEYIRRASAGNAAEKCDGEFSLACGSSLRTLRTLQLKVILRKNCRV